MIKTKRRRQQQQCGRQKRRMNRFPSKNRSKTPEKLHNHSVMQATIYRHNNKPLNGGIASK
jgi:hypothetical protein